jgi:hypothetical protein
MGRSVARKKGKEENEGRQRRKKVKEMKEGRKGRKGRKCAKEGSEGRILKMVMRTVMMRVLAYSSYPSLRVLFFSPLPPIYLLLGLSLSPPPPPSFSLSPLLPPNQQGKGLKGV